MQAGPFAFLYPTLEPTAGRPVLRLHRPDAVPPTSGLERDLQTRQLGIDLLPGVDPETLLAPDFVEVYAAR